MARTEQSEEAREANRRRMKAVREEQSDAAREEQSDEAREAAREADTRPGRRQGRQISVGSRQLGRSRATRQGTRRPGRKISVGRRRLVSVYVSFRSPTMQKKRRR